MIVRLALAAAAALVVAAPAAAHVTANPSTAPSDGYAVVEFQVPHGCDGSATTSLSLRIPEGVVSVKPEAVAGWKVSTKIGKYAEPVDLFGETITEGVKEVTWSGGNLPDDQYQDFGLSVKFPPLDPGTKLSFPAVQRCVQGVTRWIQVPVEGEEEPEEPTPQVELIAAEGEGHGSSGTMTGEEEPAAEETAAEETAEAAPASSSDDDAEDTANLALVLAIAGLLAGLGALGVTLWRRPRRA
jgi:uncharacterized protein YcnI